MFHQVELSDNTFANPGLGTHLAQFERECRNDVLRLDGGHTVPEHPRLAVEILEALGALADLMPVYSLGVVAEDIFMCQGRTAAAEGVLEIAGLALWDVMLREAVLLVVVYLGDRSVDGQLCEVRTAQADQLCIQVGEVTKLKQRVVGEIDSRHHVGRVECDLFCLGKEVVGVPIQHHASDRLHRNLFFRNDFR
ncbi:Uncharacterised protein [Mycobacteroides abscessus]|nr:Uncharacterised protein [Mycobacteroides abscessus]SIC52739.1 Uncharacterised protein [Mycobacteroides abscessus subsp. abscessus]